jgi:hypothetical protein
LARAERDVFSTSSQAALTASLTMQAAGVSYWFQYNYDKNLATVGYSPRTADNGIDFNISFLVFPARAAGTYTDTLNVTVCYDEACTRKVSGSPFTFPIRLDVAYFARPEEGVKPWAPTQTTVLAHDVLGAAYSAALDAVITVSARPEPLLRIHDLRTGLTRSQPLQTAPTSLSVGVDGLQAAVGHDAAVSLVDLHPDAAAPIRRIAVPMSVGSVVLTGKRVVAIGAEAFGQNSVYWVDTVTGVATKAGPVGPTNTVSIAGLVDVVLHPAGDRIYMANRGISPDDVIRMDLGDDPVAAEIHDSRYHGDYPFCSRVAISPDGRRLYTGCGVVLSTASLLGDDMFYAGRMALSPQDPSNFGQYVSAAVDVAPDNASVALLEENRFTCAPRGDRLSDCHTRIAVYDVTTLERRSLHALAPFERGGDRLKQWGRSLMHRADGSLLVIAEVRTLGEATPTWLLHRLNP